MKQIKSYDVAKIQRLSIEIFEEEDNYYPDYRIITNKWRAIDRILHKMSDDEDERRKVYNSITDHNFNSSDYTYKPICDDLKSLGYEII
ncbi:hypothetical protein [Caviibacter abscessus]|uniref:hypothetical protein n=1 Tax=Caviibacter abscessus TaxID=1766719 RepID=UPI000839A2E7|nr:hypothetical protein [Caviibacter abscessus]